MKEKLEEYWFKTVDVLSASSFFLFYALFSSSLPSSPLLPLPPPNKYVCDVGRGGHLSLFIPYLTTQEKYGYTQWPIQPWYQEQQQRNSNSNKQITIA